jgi:hypothetical protein
MEARGDSSTQTIWLTSVCVTDGVPLTAGLAVDETTADEDEQPDRCQPGPFEAEAECRDVSGAGRSVIPRLPTDDESLAARNSEHSHASRRHRQFEFAFAVLAAGADQRYGSGGQHLDRTLTDDLP